MFKVPLIASAIVHATIVAAAVVGGHGPSSSASATATLEIPVALEATEAPQPVVPQPAAPAPLPVNVDAHVHSHTHDYPVPLDHDRPHDPSLVHDRAPTHEEVNEASAVVALPAAAPEAAPVFNIVVGPAVAPPTTTRMGLTAVHASPAVAVVSEPVPESAVNVPARLLASAPPVYPPAARAAEVEADVVVDLVLDDTGHVADAKVTRPAGYGLDHSAVDAIRGYRFSPAQKDGRPVRVRMHWTVQFRLR